MKRATPAARYAAEFVGTFFLVLTVGCNLHAGSIGAALSIGGLLAAMVSALSAISRAHFNPAITLAVLLSGRGGMGLGEVICYMLFQILGGVLGTFAYWGVVGKEPRRVPAFHYAAGEAFWMEAIYSWALCYVFLNVVLTDIRANRSGSPRPANGLAVGLTVTAAVVAIGPVSGCSLNPAVTLGSYSVGRFLAESKQLTLCCPFTFAPFVGSILGALSFFLVRGGLSGRYLEAEDDDRPRREAAWYASQEERLPRLPPRERVVRMRPEDRTPPPGSLCPGKQEPVALPRDLAERRLLCGLRWRLKQGAAETCDVDLSCVKFAAGGECLGAVYFHEKSDLDNGIVHSGDEVSDRAGLVDNEIVTLRLSDIRPNVHALIFTMTIYSSEHSFDDIEQCYLRLVDISNGNKEFCRWETRCLAKGANGLIAAMLHRSGDHWSFKALDEVFSLPPNSSCRMLVPQMSDCVLRTASGSPHDA